MPDYVRQAYDPTAEGESIAAKLAEIEGWLKALLVDRALLWARAQANEWAAQPDGREGIRAGEALHERYNFDGVMGGLRRIERLVCDDTVDEGEVLATIYDRLLRPDFPDDRAG